MTIPVILDVARLAGWFVERGEPVTRDEWAPASARVGRNEAPALLDGHDLLAPEVLGRALCDAWEMAEHPVGALPVETWIELFNRFSFLDNGVQCWPPDEPILLFRGSGELGRAGMSWSSSSEIAEWFAKRCGDDGRVWTAIFQPEELLARIHDPANGRGESEFVVFPAAGVDRVEEQR